MLIAGCGVVSEMNLSADANGHGNNIPSEIQAPCGDCFNLSCAWQNKACAGDPECAAWLGGAQTCSSDGATFSPNAACLEQNAPTSGGSRRLADALLGCLAGAQGCCGAGASAGYAGSSGSGPNEPADSGASGKGGVGGAPDQNTEAGSGAIPCAGCSCAACLGNAALWSAQDNACKDAIATCTGAVTTATPCGSVEALYSDCLSPEAGTAAQCLSTNVYANPNLSSGIDEFVTMVLPCAARHCVENCWPPAEVACVTCQMDSCPDEWALYLGDVAAQQLHWCRMSAAGNAVKMGDCFTEFANGADAFQTLGDCTFAKCAADCTTLF